MSEANELLRSHVTRVGFDLSLGRTQVAALVYLDQCIEQDRYIRHRSGVFSYFASGIHGCMRRGLVTHCYDPEHRDDGLRWHYSITDAGYLTIGLLREAGLYDEYAFLLAADAQLTGATDA